MNKALLLLIVRMAQVVVMLAIQAEFPKHANRVSRALATVIHEFPELEGEVYGSTDPA